MVILWAKSPNRNCWFEAQTRKPERVVLRPNHKNHSHRFWDQTNRTVDLGFDAEPRNTRSSSLCARCRPHTALSDLSIIRLPGTGLVLDHRQSSAPTLLLLPRSSSLPAMPHLSLIHHETCKHVSPHETNSKIEPPKFLGFKFKSRQVNYSSQIKQGTDHLVS
jgi:hypothetical protein